MYAQHIMGQVITRGGHTHIHTHHTHTHTHTPHTHTYTVIHTLALTHKTLPDCSQSYTMLA